MEPGSPADAAATHDDAASTGSSHDMSGGNDHSQGVESGVQDEPQRGGGVGRGINSGSDDDGSSSGSGSDSDRYIDGPDRGTDTDTSSDADSEGDEQGARVAGLARAAAARLAALTGGSIPEFLVMVQHLVQGRRREAAAARAAHGTNPSDFPVPDLEQLRAFASSQISAARRRRNSSVGSAVSAGVGSHADGGAGDTEDDGAGAGADMSDSDDEQLPAPSLSAHSYMPTQVCGAVWHPCTSCRALS